MAAWRHGGGQAALAALRRAVEPVAVTFLAHVHAGAGGDVGSRVAVAVLVLHVVAAGSWLVGVAVVVARRVAIARVAPLLTVAALTTVATGVVNARIHIEAPSLLTHRAYGWVFLAKLALVAVAVAVARVVRRSGRRALLRLEGVALSGAAVAGVMLALLPGLDAAVPAFRLVAHTTNDPECRSQVDGAFAAAREVRPGSTLTFSEPSQPIPDDAVRVPDCTVGDDDLANTAQWLGTMLARRGSPEITVVVDGDERGTRLATALGAR